MSINPLRTIYLILRLLVGSGFHNSIPGPSGPRGVDAAESEIYPQDQFADGLAIFQPPMRFGCFRKGKYTTNSRLQPTALHSFECRSSAAEDFFARVDEISEAPAGNSNRFGHQRGREER